MTPRNKLAYSLFLGLCVLALFWRTGGFDFTNYDDPCFIYDNEMVKGGLSWNGLDWSLSATYMGLWLPLTWWSHMLDCSLFGLQAGYHHLAAMGWHLLNTLLLFRVLGNLTGCWKRSALVAVLFALHPLHVESVVWLSERKDLLSGFFFLLALLFYERYARPQCQNEGGNASRFRRRQWFGLNAFLHGGRYYWLSLLCFCLGIMSKPMVVTLPFVLVMLDFWPLKRWPSAPVVLPAGSGQGSKGGVDGGGALARLLGEKAPFFGISALFCLVTYLNFRGQHYILSAQDSPWALRLSNIPISYVRYLVKTVCPVPLMAVYLWPQHWNLGWVMGALGGLGALTLLGGAVRKRAPYLLWGWCFFLGMLVPAIGIFPLGAHCMADRYTYLPLIGLLIALVWGGAEWAKRRNWPRATLHGLALLLVCGTAVLTWKQIGYWRNSFTLWTHCLKVVPDHYFAHHNLAQALQHAQRWQEAALHYREAIRLNPALPEAHLNLGLVLLKERQIAEGCSQLALACTLRPADPSLRLCIGRALLEAGDKAKAVAYFEEAVQLEPCSAESRSELAESLLGLGRPAEAVREYQRALELAPDNVTLLNNLAWLLAVNPDGRVRNGPSAVKLAERACALNQNRTPVVVGTLAAAYAESGRFDEAVATAQRAADLAAQQGLDALAESNRRFARTFANHQAVRQEAVSPSAAATVR